MYRYVYLKYASNKDIYMTMKQNRRHNENLKILDRARGETS
jgi:hypothetical protein